MKPIAYWRWQADRQSVADRRADTQRNIKCGDELQRDHARQNHMDIVEGSGATTPAARFRD